MQAPRQRVPLENLGQCLLVGSAACNRVDRISQLVTTLEHEELVPAQEVDAAHQARPLVAVVEGLVLADVKNIRCSLSVQRIVEVLTAKGLPRLSEGRVKEFFITYPIRASMPQEHPCVHLQNVREIEEADPRSWKLY